LGGGEVVSGQVGVVEGAADFMTDAAEDHG
jgi:hypothetical protein